MSDRRRIVTLNSAGAPTTVKDLEDTTNFQSVAGSFTVKPPPPNPIIAKRQRAYGGGRTVGLRHDNGAIAWKMLVRGTSADNAMLNAEAALVVLLSARTDLFYEWRPEGATSSVFYEVRGPATFTASYDWAQWTGASSMYIDVEIPVGPLARGVPVDYAISSTTLPAVFSMSNVPGDAPALADVTLTTSGGSSPPIWALFGWAPHPGSPLSTYVAPFGIIEAESAASVSGWTIHNSDATYRNSSGYEATASGAGSATAFFNIDPSVMTPDDYALGEIDIEVWVRVKYANTVLTPSIAAAVLQTGLIGVGEIRYTAEFGSAGRTLPAMSSGTNFRMTRAGVITMPCDPNNQVGWQLVLITSWAAGSSGTVGLDYVMCVPAKARACSKTGVSVTTSFINSTSTFSKTIRGQDLTGTLGTSTAGAKGRDSGLGGSPIELPPGNVDMLLKLSSLVPDNPAGTALSEQLAHTGVTGNVHVTPRYYLAKGQ